MPDAVRTRCVPVRPDTFPVSPSPRLHIFLVSIVATRPIDLKVQTESLYYKHPPLRVPPVIPDTHRARPFWCVNDAVHARCVPFRPDACQLRCSPVRTTDTPDRLIPSAPQAAQAPAAPASYQRMQDRHLARHPAAVCGMRTPPHVSPPRPVPPPAGGFVVGAARGAGSFWYDTMHPTVRISSSRSTLGHIPQAHSPQPVTVHTTGVKNIMVTPSQRATCLTT